MSLWKLSALASLLIAGGSLCASPITLSYTQYFDFPGIAGRPSATWTAVFDLATHPTNPFDQSSPSVNADFISDGLSFLGTKPSIGVWDGDKIAAAQSVFFSYRGTTYVEAPGNQFDHCTQPCTDVAVKPDFAFAGFTLVNAMTLDVFSGAAAPATVPEPSMFSLEFLGLVMLLAVSRSSGPYGRRVHHDRSGLL